MEGFNFSVQVSNEAQICRNIVAAIALVIVFGISCLRIRFFITQNGILKHLSVYIIY